MHCLASTSLRRRAAGVVAFAAATLTATVVSAQGQMAVQPSGRATTEVVLAAPEKGAKAPVIRIDYGQPHLRGRQLHTGDLVPYDEAWRLGANAATKLMTDVDLMIGGKAIAKGTYVLRAMPSKTAWKLMVEKDQGQSPMGQAPGDKPAEPVATIDLKHSTMQAPLESFTMWLIPSTKPGAAHGELRFAWGTNMLSTDWTAK